LSIADANQVQTRARLLEAAGEVFAEQGFRSATVRDICERAGANIAAVNYHFQGKDQLYAAVLRHAHQCALEQYPPTLGLSSNANPQARLHAFVRAFLLRIFDDGRPAWFGKLMAREMMEPTVALDELVAHTIRPQSEALAAIIREVLGPNADDELIRQCIASVVGQCLFYHHARPVIERLFPQQKYSTKEIERLADHITAFSFSALEQFAMQQRDCRREAS